MTDASRPYAGLRDAAGAYLWFNGQPSVAFGPRVALRVGDRTFGTPTSTTQACRCARVAPPMPALHAPATSAYLARSTPAWRPT